MVSRRSAPHGTLGVEVNAFSVGVPDGVGMDHHHRILARPNGRAPGTRPLLAAAAGQGQLHERVVPADTPILREGDEPREVFVVLTGLASLSRSRGSHRSTITVVHPGEAFGDVEVLTSSRMHTDARTLVTSRLGSIAVPVFLGALANDASAAVGWLAGMAARLAVTEGRLGEHGVATVEGRLAALLLDESRFGEVILTQTTLASLLGVHRSSVNRIVHRFQDAGAVAPAYRRIRILDREALERIAKGQQEVAEVRARAVATA
jgi:CRP-like cAMP-binding protein